MPPPPLQLQAEGQDTAENQVAEGSGTSGRDGTPPENPISLDEGFFAMNSVEEEQWVENAGVGGTRVAVKMGDWLNGHIQVRRGVNDFESVTEGGDFIPLESGALAGLFGENVQIGVFIQVMNAQVTGYGSLRIGGVPIRLDNFGTVIDQLGWPGITSNAAPSGVLGGMGIMNDLSNGEFKFQAVNVPICLGNRVEAVLDFGFENMQPSVSIRGIINISEMSQAMIELTHNGEGFSGSASIMVVKEPFSGELTAIFENGQMAISGTASVMTDRFDGSVTMVVGSKEYLHGEVARQIASLEGGVAPLNQQTEGSPGELGIAGWGSGNFQINDKINANMDVVVDEEDGLTVGGGVGLTEPVEVVEGRSGNIETPPLTLEFPYGIPVLANLNIEVSLLAGLNYNLGKVMLDQAQLSGLYSNSTAHQVTNRIDLEGEMSATAGVGGYITITAGVGAEALGNELELNIGANATLGLDMLAALQGRMSLLGGEEGASFQAQAEGSLNGAANLSIEGFVEAVLDCWGPYWDRSWRHDFDSIQFELGNFELLADFDSERENPFSLNMSSGTFDQETMIAMMDTPGLKPAEFEDGSGRVSPGNETDFTLGGDNGDSQAEFLAGQQERMDESLGSAPEAAGENESQTDSDEPLTEEDEAQLEGVQIGYVNEAGEPHRLIYKESGDGIEVYRHSEESLLEDYLAGLLERGGLSEDERAKIEQSRSYLVNEEWKEEMEGDDERAELRRKGFLELRELLVNLEDVDKGERPIPEAPSISPTLENGKPGELTVSHLHVTNKPRGQDSSQANVDYYRDAWQFIIDSGKTGEWVQFHLLNDNLGGKATGDNLIMAPRRTNKGFLDNVEKQLKEMMSGRGPSGKPEVIWLECSINYHNPSDSFEHAHLFPNGFFATAGKMEYVAGQWVKATEESLSYSDSIGLPEMLGSGSGGALRIFHLPPSSDTAEINRLAKDYGIWRGNLKWMSDNVRGPLPEIDQDTASQNDENVQSSKVERLIHFFENNSGKSGSSVTRFKKHFRNLANRNLLNFD